MIGEFFFFFPVDKIHDEIRRFAFDQIIAKIDALKEFYEYKSAALRLIKKDYKIQHTFSSLYNLIESVQMILNTCKTFTYDDKICLLYHNFKKPSIIIEDKKSGEPLFANADFILMLELVYGDDFRATITGFGVKRDGWINAKNNAKIEEPLHCFENKFAATESRI